MKKIFILLLCLVTVFAIVSCGGSSDNGGTTCTAHTDANGDGKCDTCGTSTGNTGTECTSHTDVNSDGKCDDCGADVEVESTTVTLFEDGEATFQFVLASEVNSSVRMMLSDFTYDLQKNGVNVSVVNDTANTTADCEILIGDVKTRGDEYLFDKYSLGKKGYVIKAVGNKIIVNAGDASKISTIVEMLINDVLGFEREDIYEIPESLTFSTADNIIEIQDDYAITSVTVGGKSIKGATIAVDKRTTVHLTTATYVQDTLYTYTGHYLPIVSLAEADANSIVISKVEDDGEWGFKIYENGTSLKIDCGFDNCLSDAVKEFIDAQIINGSGTVALGATTYTKRVRIVTYEQFGAKGDGRTDDFFAIVEAHKFANEGGQTVVATPGKTYYLKNNLDKNGSVHSIQIKTNTIWTDANFILDDTGFNQTDKNNSTVIRISSDYSSVEVYDKATIEKIFSGTTLDRDTFDKINWSDFGYAALVFIRNEDTIHYIRGPGGDSNDGGAQQELIEVDANGNLVNNSELMYDFTNITSIAVYRIDERVVTLTGGTITTIANDRPYRENVDNSPYISRNMNIARSNTIVDGLTHIVVGEEEQYIDGEKRHAYSGFFSVNRTANVTLKNCNLTARRYCKAAGTYDFSASFSNNLTLYKCKQLNFLNEDGTAVSDMRNYWGIGGTNYCKNLTYDTCTLSRFDAHEGLRNGKVINCTVNSLELIGKGEMLVENTTFVVMNSAPIALRGDYGATWEGTITVKDCTFRYTKNLPTTYSVIGNSWNNHFYGYLVYFPNIIIDNLKFENLPEGKTVYVCPFANTDTVYDSKINGGNDENLNPYMPPEFIKVINWQENGVYFYIKDIPFFAGVELEGVIVE